MQKTERPLIVHGYRLFDVSFLWSFISQDNSVLWRVLSSVYGGTHLHRVLYDLYGAVAQDIRHFDSKEST